MTTADPPSPDLDALEQALAGMTPGPWRYGALEHGGRYVTDGRGYLFAQVDDDGNGHALVAAVNALPGLIAEVRRLRAALGEAADAAAEGNGCECCGGYSIELERKCEAWWSSLAAPARTDEAT